MKLAIFRTIPNIWFQRGQSFNLRSLVPMACKGLHLKIVEILLPSGLLKAMNITAVTGKIVLLMLLFASCRKDVSNNISLEKCNGVMQLTKIQTKDDPSADLEAKWAEDGTLSELSVLTSSDEVKVATFTYLGNRVTKADIRIKGSNEIIDVATYEYNNIGLIDALYLENDPNTNLRFSYNDTTLSRITGYRDAEAIFYWQVQFDTDKNIKQAELFVKQGSNFVRESMSLYTRDNKKNPLEKIAIHMLPFNEGDEIFTYWGPNNLLRWRYQNYLDADFDITVKKTHLYNENCYPTSYKVAIEGVPEEESNITGMSYK